MLNRETLKVWLKESVYQSILRELLVWSPRETGGVLMGYWVNSIEVVLTEAVGPGPNAIHTFSSFVPDSSFHRKEVERIYIDSNRIVTYLGDWHTHPMGSPFLSTRDKQTLTGLGRYKPARLIVPLMLIVSTHPTDIKIWSCHYQGKFIKPDIKLCEIINF